METVTEYKSFELRKNEITASAVAEIEKLKKKNDYVHINIVEKILLENQILRKKISIYEQEWINVSEAMALTGYNARKIYKLMDNGILRTLVSVCPRKVNRYDLISYYENNS